LSVPDAETDVGLDAGIVFGRCVFMIVFSLETLLDWLVIELVAVELVACEGEKIKFFSELI
jgi:hypothetical protein